MICYDHIDKYIRGTIKKDAGFLHELRLFAENHNVPIVQPEVARLLTVLGNMRKPGRILDVGTAIGYSAILFSMIIKPGGKVDTIDRSESMAEIAKENIRKAGFHETVNVIIGDALEILKCLDKKYDMIFLDAAKGQYPDFLPECRRLLNTGGLLISDNVLYKGMVACDDLIVRRKRTIVKRMRDYLNTLCNDPALDTAILSMGDGVAVSYKI